MDLLASRMLMINKCNLILFLLVISFFYTVPQSVWAGESDTYNFSWLDPDKEVYVLQNRRYRKANRLHVYAGVGKTLSGAFVDSSNIQGRAGHYFMEEYGFEVIYSKNSGKENTTAANVRDNGSGTGSRPFRRIVDTYYGGMFLWSPFYSKINTFNTIIYYDWIFGAGIGKIKESNNADESPYLDVLKELPDNSFSLGSIDGRLRSQSLINSANKIISGGHLLLDNSDRKEYSEGMKYLNNIGWEEKTLNGLGYAQEWESYSCVWKKP